MKLFLTLLAILAAGCSSAGHVAPQHSGSPHALSARIVLPTRTVTAGSSISGRVVVTNNTGRAIHPVGCLYLFAVYLTSRTFHPDDVGGPACAERFTIPAGVSTYRIAVSAIYHSCGPGPPSTTRPCMNDGRPPPIPAGKYRAKLLGPVQAPPVPVRVIPRS